MSNTMTCVGCGEDSSRYFIRFRDGLPCAACGLSAHAAGEVLRVRVQQADERLKTQLEEALVRADRAEDRERRLRAHLEGLLGKAREVAGEMDDPRPWLKEW